jgi:hypothetical protein
MAPIATGVAVAPSTSTRAPSGADIVAVAMLETAGRAQSVPDDSGLGITWTNMITAVDVRTRCSR